MRIKLNIILSYGIFLIFPNLIFGPAIPDFLIILTGLLGLFLILKNKYFDLIFNYYTYLFLIWALYLILLSLFSKDLFLSLESSLFYFRFYLFSLAILYLLKSEIFFKKYLFSVITLTYSFIILISIILILIPDIELPFIDRFPENSRLKGPFYENIMGGYLVKFLPLIIISYFLTENSFTNKILLLTVFILSSFLIFMTGERSAIIMLLLLYLLFYFNKFIILKFKFLIFIVLLSVLFVTYVTYPSFGERVIFTLNQFNVFDKEMISQNIYFNYFQNAFMIFKENILFGSGPKMFRVLCENYLYLIEESCSTHPHNLYFQLLSETGLIGFSFIVILYLYIIYRFIFLNYNSNLQQSDYNIAFFSFASFIMIFFPFATSNNFFNNYVNIFYFIYLGLFINTVKNIDGPKNNFS